MYLFSLVEVIYALQVDLYSVCSDLFLTSSAVVEVALMKDGHHQMCWIVGVTEVQGIAAIDGGQDNGDRVADGAERGANAGHGGNSDRSLA